jgi:uncharacterized protein (TIGR02611 family)
MLIKTAKRVVVAVIGGTVLLFGLAMLVLPGPGFLGVVAGLAILATEFAWAGWLLKRVRERASAVVNSIRGTHGSTQGVPKEEAN